MPDSGAHGVSDYSGSVAPHSHNADRASGASARSSLLDAHSSECEAPSTTSPALRAWSSGPGAANSGSQSTRRINDFGRSRPWTVSQRHRMRGWHRTQSCHWIHVSGNDSETCTGVRRGGVDENLYRGSRRNREDPYPARGERGSPKPVRDRQAKGRPSGSTLA